jgi:2-methylcitrate dehydratase PrpD
MAAHQVSAGDVERVTITLDEQGARTVNGRTMADINIQHLAALMLLDGDITFESSHSSIRVRDPKVLKLRERIAIVGSAALSKAKTTQAIAEIVTRDGRKLRHHTREVRGTATNPMTREDITAKSRGLLVPVMGKRRAEALIAAVMTLDTLRDVRQLRRLLQLG